MEQPPDPQTLKEKTSPTNLFNRFKEVEIAGVRFRLRRLTLMEELAWYGERERILGEPSGDRMEKIVNIWESLLSKVVLEPRCQRYTEELPAAVIAKLLETVFDLHLWNMDFPISRQDSSSTNLSNTPS